MITFAGVYLPTPPADVLARVEGALDTRTIVDWERRHWPGRSFTFTAFHEENADRPLRVNSLHWPVGASRWAVGRFIVDDVALASIRQSVYATTSTNYTHAPLFMSDERDATGTYQITANMYMLPPRPIWQNVGGANGLWLLTLVDDRFFWWERSGAIEITEGTTTWSQLYSMIGTILGVTITVDTIETYDLWPSKAFTTSYEAMPLLLDAAAHSCGQRIVRRRNGDVLSQNPLFAASQVQVNLMTNHPLEAGGLFQISL